MTGHLSPMLPLDDVKVGPPLAAPHGGWAHISRYQPHSRRGTLISCNEILGISGDAIRDTQQNRGNRPGHCRSNASLPKSSFSGMMVLVDHQVLLRMQITIAPDGAGRGHLVGHQDI